MNTKIILKSENFLYPTEDERKLYSKEIPKISRLNIEYRSFLINFLQNGKIQNSINEDDAYWWNMCLNNRFGKLKETFLYVLTHYNRFKKNELEKDESNFTEDFLYNYYIEIFYYYFYSVRDILGQLINVLYQLGVGENKIFLNKSFIEKIPDKDIKSIFEDFINSTSHSYANFRNAFNHRFTPTQKDSRIRTTISISEDEKNIGFIAEKEISKEEFYEDSKILMNQLANLMEKFQEYISKK